MPKPVKKSSAAPDRSALLASIPIHNHLVRATPHESGLRLIAPLKPSSLRRIFSPARSTTPEKSFDLDDLGAWVWNHLDGKADIEALITSFAAEHRVNLRESEIAILHFLKTLTQRNLIALIAK
jgi:hypothetical protein